MTRRAPTDTEKKLAKRFQRLAEDELGYRPSLMHCQRLVVAANDAGAIQGQTLEERASLLFVTHERDLRARSNAPRVKP